MDPFPVKELVSVERVHRTLQAEVRPERKDKILPPFLTEEFRHPDNFTINTDERDSRAKFIIPWCKRLFDATSEPSKHVEELDHVLSGLIQCNFVLKNKNSEDRHGVYSGNALSDPTAISQSAAQVLNRLPPRPLPLPDFDEGLPTAFFERSFSQDITNKNQILKRTWDNLSVTSFICTNVIRGVLFWVIYGHSMELFRDPVNCFSELIDQMNELALETSSETDAHRWFIVRAFLWNAWQRSAMLNAFVRLGGHLKSGFEHGDEKGNYLRTFFPVPGISIQDLTDQTSAQGKATSMCTWAFELLRSDPASLGLDFRLFHERYLALFENKPARCKPGSSEPCDGKHSDNCQRFKGMVINDQTAHDGRCPRFGIKDDHVSGTEAKLIWDRESFISVQGPKGVSLSNTSFELGLLRYCKASGKTLTISHVWAHGQGGRPEDGINLCLHNRYARIAKSLGCDSYWMDTTCIPTPRDLRKEAISQINGVFDRSEVTVFCDRDLMEIDASKLTLQLRESIIAAVLVCDWNIRAWTFLEAMKGRQAMHILCKDDVVIRFQDLLKYVWEFGRIDVVIFCQLSPHLLPELGHGFYQNSKYNMDNIRLEGIGTLLSFRPASRPGDDVLIWGLLARADKPPIYDAKEFWSNRVGRVVTTGFLVSSASRLRIRGFSWAPATPYAAPKAEDSQASEDFYRAFEGTETEVGVITENGLYATWFVHEFPALSFKTLMSTAKSLLNAKSDDKGVTRELNKIRARFLRTVRCGALLRPAALNAVYWREGPSRYRGKARGTVLVVVGSNCNTVVKYRGQESYEWTWKGIYEWPEGVPLPNFEIQHELCII